MQTSWKRIRSLFGPSPARTQSAPTSSRATIVALIASEAQRRTIASICEEENWDALFAESVEDACTAASRSAAPVILCDHDWPEIGWRAAVQCLASLPHRPCVILTSRVSDDYLWEELIRHGGHDLLAKPMRTHEAARTVRLAMTYWKNMAGPVLMESKPVRGAGDER